MQYKNTDNMDEHITVDEYSNHGSHLSVNHGETLSEKDLWIANALYSELYCFMDEFNIKAQQ